MLPEHIALIFQQLSYIVIVICGPVIAWLVVKSIIHDLKLASHEEKDKLVHIELNHHIGKHYSQINDLQVDFAGLEATITGRNNHI